MGAPAVSVMRENSLPWWNRGYGVITEARHTPRVARVCQKHSTHPLFIDYKMSQLSLGGDILKTAAIYLFTNAKKNDNKAIKQARHAL